MLLLVVVVMQVELGHITGAEGLNAWQGQGRGGRTGRRDADRLRRVGQQQGAGGDVQQVGQVGIAVGIGGVGHVGWAEGGGGGGGDRLRGGR